MCTASVLAVPPSMAPLSTLCNRCVSFLRASGLETCAYVTISRNRGFRVSSCLRLGIGRNGELPSQIVEQNTWREQIWSVCLFSRPRSSHSRSLRRVVVRAHRPRYVGLRSIPKSAVFLGTSGHHLSWALFVLLGFHPCFSPCSLPKISRCHELCVSSIVQFLGSAQGRIGRRRQVMCTWITALKVRIGGDNSMRYGSFILCKPQKQVALSDA